MNAALTTAAALEAPAHVAMSPTKLPLNPACSIAAYSPLASPFSPPEQWTSLGVIVRSERTADDRVRLIDGTGWSIIVAADHLIRASR